MTLDLEDLTADWKYEAGEICARMVAGRDGADLLQLRVDLGVMQMFPDGRPDGQRYRGFPSVLAYVRHEAPLGWREVTSDDWRELERELFQVNYRRLALSSLIEDCLARDEVDEAALHIRRALRDIETCLERIGLMRRGPQRLSPSQIAMRPTLVFHRGRLRVQLEVIREAYEEAVEQAVQGAAALEALLLEMGVDEEGREEDPGLAFLQDLATRLRQEYDIPLTLHEQLEQAVENDDFEAAARLRDALRRRGSSRSVEDSLPDVE